MPHPRRAETIKNPCGFDESFAWIAPDGAIHYLRNGQTHLDWAAQWVLDHIPPKDIPYKELLEFDPSIHIEDFDPFEDVSETRDIISEWSFKYFLAHGWVRVVNALAFQAHKLQDHPVQAETVLSVILQGIQSGCVKPDLGVWYTDSLDVEGIEKRYSVAAFARWIGGKKAEEQVFDVALSKMASRVANTFIQRNPCKNYESFAWLSPKGHFYYLRGGKTHMEWAAEWVLAHVKDIPWDEVSSDYDGPMKVRVHVQEMMRGGEFDPAADKHLTLDFLRYWAFGYLIIKGWIRVVNATAFQAENIEQLPQVEEILKVIMQGVVDGCVKPDTRIWYLDGASDDAPDRGMPAADFVKWLGGRKAEDELFSVAMQKTANTTKNPCVRESFAWLSPTGALHYLSNDEAHHEWALHWLRQSGDPEFNASVGDEDRVAIRAFKALLSRGWVRVVNATNFEANDLRAHAPQVKAILDIFFQGVSEGCVTPATDVYVEQFKDGDKTFAAEDFAQWLGGRKAEERFYEMLTERTQRIMRWAAKKNPCVADESYAWIDPGGKVIYLGPGDVHVEWAGGWVRNNVKDIPYDDIYGYHSEEHSPAGHLFNMWALEYLIEHGWVRVVNAQAFQGKKGLQNLERTSEAVVEIVMSGARSGCIDPETEVWFTEGAGDDERDTKYTAADFVRWLGGRQAEGYLYDLATMRTGASKMAWGKLATIKNPCKEVESLAWITPTGQVRYLQRGQTHPDWAAQWVYNNVQSKDIPYRDILQRSTHNADPKFANFDPIADKAGALHLLNDWAIWYLLSKGWVRVANVTNFMALDLQPMGVQAERVIDFVMRGVEGGCVRPMSMIYLESGDIKNMRGQEFEAAEFVKMLGGRKAEEKLYEVALQKRVAMRIADTILKDPCTKASFAWISPTGDIHYLTGDIHMGWAGKWVEKNDPKAFAGIQATVENLWSSASPAAREHEVARKCLWALLEQGWVRVANAQNYQAYDLRPGTSQADQVVEVILAGVKKGCLIPETKVFLAMSSDGVGRTREYTAGDFAKWLGGRRAEESVYEIAMTPVVRVAHRNPCADIKSYAWIDPTGKVEYLPSRVSHNGWASKWVSENVQDKDIPYTSIIQENEYLLEGSYLREFFQQLKSDFGKDWASHYDPAADPKMKEGLVSLGWAHEYLLTHGWVRVASPVSFRAYDLQGSHQRVQQAVLDIVIEGAQEKCVEPERSIFLDAGTIEAPISKRYSAVDFVKMLGGRKAEDALYSAAMGTKAASMASRVAQHHLAQGQ